MKILIAEDEATVARRIARLSAEILGSHRTELIFARNVGEARSAMLTTDPDLLILDLNLEGEEGFSLLRHASGQAFETIVISAHTERALEAFRLGVRDFVPKPFGRERLETALQRVLRSSRSGQPLRFLGVRTEGRVDLISIESVLYIEGAGARSRLHLRDGRTLQHEKMLDRLGSILPSHFERIHKSYLVDIRQVRSLQSGEGSRYSIILQDGTELPVGRTRIRRLRKLLMAPA